VEARPQASLNPAIKLTLYFFVAHYFVEIFYTYLPGTSSAAAQVANGSVGILVVFLAITLQLLTRRSVWNMCNVFFIAMLLTYGLYFMPEGSALRNLARYIHAFEQMGYIAAYYLLGCVFKKHGDFRLFKLCLVIILPLSMLSYLIPGTISAYAPDSLPLAATLITAAVFIGFILLSPAYSKHLFAADWSDAFSSVDMTEAVRKVEESNLLENLKLTPREKEVAALLLQGNDAKQIAAELSISVHTANFHTKNLYKKLGINKRSELFARLYSDSVFSEI
jgi:DNA-binding CsgD family transcriptional regulator